MISKNDRVSLQIFDKTIRRFFEPGSTRRQLHTLLTALENNKPGNETSLAEALHRAHPLIKRKGTLVVLSDFFDEPEAIFKALNPYLHRGFRVHLFHILDPAEMTLPDRGLTRFVDLESNDQLVIHPETLREDWKSEMRRHTQALRRLAAGRQVDYATTLTTDSWFSLFDRLA